MTTAQGFEHFANAVDEPSQVKNLNSVVEVSTPFRNWVYSSFVAWISSNEATFATSFNLPSHAVLNTRKI